MSAADPIVLLAGGGVETSALLPRLIAGGHRVQPFHVRCGFAWEARESASLIRLVAACGGERVLPLVEVGLPLDGVLQSHWAFTGSDAPVWGSLPDGLEIPLRNITLLAAAAIRFRALPELVIAAGTTADNHFGDGSRAFFDSSERLLSMALGRKVSVLTPLIELSKPAIIKACDPALLALSWSCITPRGQQHCGSCIKCGRRREAFAEAGVADPTSYASPAGVRPGSTSWMP